MYPTAFAMSSLGDRANSRLRADRAGIRGPDVAGADRDAVPGRVMRSAACLLVVAGALTLLPAQTFDHVTVTSDQFADRFAQLGELVEDELGLSDTVVTVEDIYAQHAGRDNQEKIRNFISYAYQNWGTTYVLLGGDVEVVPHRNARASRLGRTGDIPCDLYYAALDGDWDANENSVFGETTDCVDMVPDVFVGRLPVSTAGQVDTLAAKVAAYCSDSGASYLRRALLTGFDLYQNPPIHGETACEFYDQFLVPSFRKPCVEVYASRGGDHRDSVLAALGRGQHIWVHADHGNWDRLGTGLGNHNWVVYGHDLRDLANGPDLCLLLSMACNVGAIDSTDCAAEDLLNAPNGGGVAALANSQVGTLLGPDWHHTASFLQVEWTLEELFEQPVHSALSVLAAVQARIAPLADTSAVYRWCQYAYSLLGEPAMPVWMPAEGVVEEDARTQRPSADCRPTIVRGILFLDQCRPRTEAALGAALVDISGRTVLGLAAGPNDVRHLVPGVYFVRRGGTGSATTKFVISR